mmetsp:Transcript_58094/g.149572  ORF Transcript_58094/g.149572 Transcript_58094/m.149572 type:complete len:256 (-) Transcript_58094:1474-2241(-)
MRLRKSLSSSGLPTRCPRPTSSKTFFMARKSRRAWGSCSRWPRPASSKIFPMPRNFFSRAGSSRRWLKPAWSNNRFRSRNFLRASGSSSRWPKPAFSNNRRRPAISSSRCFSLASSSSARDRASARSFVRPSSCFLYWSAETSNSPSSIEFLFTRSPNREARVCSSSSYIRFAALSSSSDGIDPRVVCFQTLSFRSATEVLHTTFEKTLSTVSRFDTYGSCAGYSLSLVMASWSKTWMLGWCPATQTSWPSGTMA